MADLVARFREIFGRGGAVRVVRGPGRVNLIGEHTDYNGGFVMPMALEAAVRLAFVPHDEPTVALWSEQFAERAEFALGAELPAETPRWRRYPKAAAEDASSLSSWMNTPPHWLRYPMAVAEVLAEAGLPLRGFTAIVDGDVPVGSGLSSSAAYEVAAALALLVAAKPDLPAGPARVAAEAHGLTTERLALLCQSAEHRVGVRCGIMDQFISLHGRRGHAIVLDCRDLSYEAVPLPADRAKVVVIDSGVRRKLTTGAYNERRSQCEEGAGRLRKFDENIRQLRDVPVDLFEALEEALPQVVRRRCRHVVTEDARVAESIEALGAGDLDRFGRLINASHNSLRDDYEVSGRELDLLVEIARSVEGVLGSRLTGAGFGGCTVSLVRPGAVEALREAVLARYPDETGLVPRLWVSEAADGAAIEV
ncbi:MAG TPA: galactokinase [Phycisphaerae bacterium]|nr:galactokinase [Phycisphaerae bacterium]